MDALPITQAEMRQVALEEGLKAAIALDAQRLAMLNYAVDWIEDMTGLSKMEIRQEIAYKKTGHIARALDTIRAVRTLLSE
jgi:hypothetical protein